MGMLDGYSDGVMDMLKILTHERQQRPNNLRELRDFLNRNRTVISIVLHGEDLKLFTDFSGECVKAVEKGKKTVDVVFWEMRLMMANLLKIKEDPRAKHAKAPRDREDVRWKRPSKIYS